MPAGERIQEQGRQGARAARLWLDHTARVRIDFSVYDYPEQVELPPVHGTSAAFDLRGHLIDENGDVSAPLFVEVKNVTGARDQKSQYMRYLANCYSVTARAIQDDGSDKRYEFMWLTWHPFWLDRWIDLTSPDLVREAVEEHRDEVLDGREIDDGLVVRVARRCWVVVLGKRHEELSMPNWMLAEIEKTIRIRSGS